MKSEKLSESRGRITRRFYEIGCEKDLQKLANYVDGFSSSEEKNETGKEFESILVWSVWQGGQDTSSSTKLVFFLTL